MLFTEKWFKRWREAKEEGREEGRQEGRQQGREERDAAWNDWNRRRIETESQGGVFTEPPPSQAP